MGGGSLVRPVVLAHRRDDTGLELSARRVSGFSDTEGPCLATGTTVVPITWDLGVGDGDTRCGEPGETGVDSGGYSV